MLFPVDLLERVVAPERRGESQVLVTLWQMVLQQKAIASLVMMLVACLHGMALVKGIL